MSAKSVETVLSRAMSDTAFAEALFASPEQALTGYDLTADETSKLKSLTRARFDTLMALPEERKSFGIIVDGRGGGTNHNETGLTVY